MRQALIHPSAIVHPDARLAPDVTVGPWTLIGADVEVGAGTVIDSHVVIKGPTRIGEHNRFYPFSTIGEDTPDLKYDGEPTRLVIGNHNTIREGVTIHRGTVQDRSETTIGDHNLLMAYVHVGHDSVLGNHCILVNNTALAGHVHIGDWAILSGFTLVHQYCHIGAHSFTGMGTALGKDLPAYVMASGNPAAAKSINAEGLRRRGFSKDDIASIQRAFKVLYRRGYTMSEAMESLNDMAGDCEALQVMVESIQNSSRGIVR
ncbi:acyl-ACP--UDP-N-acetylglucosamine O-acyltransferase [Marinimicrobium sp. ARAG 43.8]|uniref:acyl-ACP--UDP-N-acetylglucosamine O-acyltransferase n=1 Tax=Marinimicrobium sp. ARAG 43.8 TaxID=3418719 RepID=UPI003CF4EAB8